MKWGVRKDKSGGGFIANFKAKRKAKRMAKTEKYRQKLQSRAERNRNANKAFAKANKNKIEDLEKNGMKSETYKKWVKNKTESDFYSDLYDYGATAAYAGKWMNELKYSDKYVADYKIAELKTRYSHRYESNKKAAKSYLKAQKAMMNLTVDETTKKRDVRRKYREALEG